MPKKRGNDGTIIDTVEIVRDAVNKQFGRFTKADIVEMCPSLGRYSVDAAIKELVRLGEVERYGTGRSTFYVRPFVTR